MVEYREAAEFITGLMPTLAEQTSPMSLLRTAVSAASAYDPDGPLPDVEPADDSSGDDSGD